MGTKTILAEIAAERRRQIEVEGWTPQHDDEHGGGELALAGACYAAYTALDMVNGSEILPRIWPHSWSMEWWKPKSRRRDLIRAGALIVAEIERLDRAKAKEAGG